MSTSFGQANSAKVSYPFDMETLEKLSYNLLQNDFIAPIYSAGSFIYINTRSKLPITPNKFQVAYPFAGKYGLVKVNGKYGIIDRSGRFIVKPAFHSFQLFWVANYGIYFDTHNYFSFAQGKLIDAPEIVCAEPVRPQLFVYKKDKKFGLISYKADSIQRPEFDSIYAGSDKIAVVSKSGKIGVIDCNGKTVLSFDNEDYAGTTGYNPILKFAIKNENSWAYYNGDCELFKSKFQPVSSNGVFLVYINSRYNYLDDQGNLILPKNYKWISDNAAIAINENDNVVFLLKGKRELIYY